MVFMYKELYRSSLFVPDRYAVFKDATDGLIKLQCDADGEYILVDYPVKLVGYFTEEDFAENYDPSEIASENDPLGELVNKLYADSITIADTSNRVFGKKARISVECVLADFYEFGYSEDVLGEAIRFVGHPFWKLQKIRNGAILISRSEECVMTDTGDYGVIVNCHYYGSTEPADNFDMQIGLMSAPTSILDLSEKFLGSADRRSWAIIATGTDWHFRTFEHFMDRVFYGVVVEHGMLDEIASYGCELGDRFDTCTFNKFDQTFRGPVRDVMFVPVI